MASSQRGQLRSYRGLVAVLILGVAVLLVRPSWAAAPLRVYATESNRETAVTSLSEKERLVDLILDRWQTTANRYGTDPVLGAIRSGCSLVSSPDRSFRN
jgi:hypothetical protein